jgi:uncharacterized protein
MHIWAISDLHLSFGVANKQMDLFGENWVEHARKMAHNWDRLVHEEDLVLIAGDVSWATRLSEALPDLAWIEQRPGTKVIVRGNHDFWWESLSKVRKSLPPSLHVIQNDAYVTPTVAIGGARLWNSTEYSFNAILDYKPGLPRIEQDTSQDAEIFARELLRLEMSLKQLPIDAPLKIAMTHYPPIGLNLHESLASRLCKKYGVHVVVFGHLHSFKPNLPPIFGTAENIRYVLTSADYLNFCPVQIG